MSTLSAKIERYLKNLLQQEQGGTIEVRRCDLAETFGCVPSQINYVLATRFTPEKGYLIESRRGGGGYIRITRANVQQHGLASPSTYYRQIGRRVSEEEAELIIQRLMKTGALDKRRATLIRAALRKETAWVEPMLRPIVRAVLLKGMLLLVLQDA